MSTNETMNDIRALPDTFEARGVDHTLCAVFAGGKIRIYQCFLSGYYFYEVIKVAITKPHPLSDDKRMVERYPSDREWGVFGFTARNLPHALKIADALIAGRAKDIMAQPYKPFSPHDTRKLSRNTSKCVLGPSETL